MPHPALNIILYILIYLLIKKTQAIFLHNMDSTTSCWKNATGKIKEYSNGTVIEGIVAVGPSCTRHATGKVKSKPTVVRHVFDKDYIWEEIQNNILSIDWTVSDGKKNGWPQWRKIEKENI